MARAVEERSELVAACPVIFALMILIVIGRRAGIARPLGMAAAAGLCVLGLENKVQVILLIGALVHRPLSRVPENALKFCVISWASFLRQRLRITESGKMSSFKTHLLKSNLSPD